MAHAFVGSALDVFLTLLNLYVWVLIIGGVLSWLVAFDVLNTQNKLVRTIGDICYRITEPALRPIRRVIPPIGGLDLSPVALIFIIYFIQSFLTRLIFAV